MVISLFGLLIPVYPGLTVIWAAALVYRHPGRLSRRWDGYRWLIFAMITILMLFGNVIDNIITSKKAYDSGASIWSVIVSLDCWRDRCDHLDSHRRFAGSPGSPCSWRSTIAREIGEKALATTRGWLVGLGWSFIIRFLTGMAMIGLWLIWALNTH